MPPREEPLPQLSPAADMRRRLKAILIGSSGNLVEWYDFYVYTAFSLYFAKRVLPAGGPDGAAPQRRRYLRRRFPDAADRGWLFGRIADRHGRRVALTTSVLLMCFGSLMIAVTPVYATIGIAAPVILLLARMLQGLSLGGEYGTSATYLSEMATAERRGFYSSFQYVTLIGGQLTAMLVLVVLQKLVLTPAELDAWGWRIPFVIGAGLAVIAYVMRRGMDESESFKAAAQHATDAPAKAPGSLRLLLQYPRECLLVVGLTLGGTVAFYTYTTYMQKFLRLSVGLSDNQTTMVAAASLIFALFLQPLYGAISDRIGRKWLLIFFGVCGTLFTIPLLSALIQTKTPFGAFLLIAAAWLIVSGYTSINAVVKAELFPTNVRATGVGLPLRLAARSPRSQRHLARASFARMKGRVPGRSRKLAGEGLELFADRFAARFQGGLIKLKLEIGTFHHMFSENGVGIRAGGGWQRFLGQRNPLVLGGGFAGVVAEFLSLLQRLELPRDRPQTDNILQAAETAKFDKLVSPGSSKLAALARLLEAIYSPLARPAQGHASEIGNSRKPCVPCSRAQSGTAGPIATSARCSFENLSNSGHFLLGL